MHFSQLSLCLGLSWVNAIISAEHQSWWSFGHIYTICIGPRLGFRLNPDSVCQQMPHKPSENSSCFLLKLSHLFLSINCLMYYSFNSLASFSILSPLFFIPWHKKFRQTRAGYFITIHRCFQFPDIWAQQGFKPFPYLLDVQTTTYLYSLYWLGFLLPQRLLQTPQWSQIVHLSSVLLLSIFWSGFGSMVGPEATRCAVLLHHGSQRDAQPPPIPKWHCKINTG